MNLVFHIGVHKTGSTAIQRFMEHNQKVLAAAGILYPTAHIINMGQHALAWALGVNHPKRDEALAAGVIARDILQEARNKRPKLLVLSTEDFESLSEESVQELRGLFAEIPAKVIVYLRRQDEALAAAYNQRVKSFGSKYPDSLAEFSQNPQIVQRYDYWALTERWARAFGDDAICVRIYDPSSFPEGNIIPDFLSAIGLPSAEFETKQWISANKSVHPLALEIVRRINNRDVSETIHLALLKHLKRTTKNQPVVIGRSEQEVRRQFMEYFEESNARVAQKWLNKSDGILFPNLAPLAFADAEASSKDDKDILIDTLIDALVDAVAPKRAALRRRLWMRK